jgi:hypothetical protein
MQELIRGRSNVCLHGYAPGVHRQHDTTIMFDGECFLFD